MSYEMKCLEGDEDRIEVTEDFVNNNNLKIDADKALEILNGKGDFLGFEHEIACDYVDFETSKHLYNEEYVKEVESGKRDHPVIEDVMEAAQDFLDYMVFAWMKARDERGISANRSVVKLAAWMKILSRPDVATSLVDGEFGHYGKTALRRACEMLGIECPEDIK